jgi:RNA polymerase sigma factor (sigma-70 family)
MDNEEIVISRVLAGNTEAFRIIVEKYQGLVFSICMSTLKNHHDAENAAQETFLKAYRFLHQYDGRSFKSWIGRIATSCAIDLYRKTKAKSQEIQFEEGLEIRDSLQVTVQDILIEKEDRERVGHLYKSLPDIYKSVVEKYYIEGMSYQSIALDEDISIKTVESRLYRAKKLLKERWNEDE